LEHCRHYSVCRLDADENLGDGCCILHSPNPNKNGDDFDKALAEHQDPANWCYRNNFRGFVFPGDVNFMGKVFECGADFTDVTFHGTASFTRATFPVAADFAWAKFNGFAGFSGAIFGENTSEDFRADFRFTKFKKGADFIDAKFWGRAAFTMAEFEDSAFFRSEFEDADFRESEFYKDSWFTGTFSKRAVFRGAKFLGFTLFQGGSDGKIFAATEVDFRNVIISPLDALIIRDADLQKCRFLGTDLRKAEITNADWPKIGKRNAVYDEKILLTKNEIPQYQHLERLNRELKQNYEDRRDYERMSDFHYGEKEMRRQNTRGLLRFALRTYRCLSGYGEDFKRAFFCVLALAAICAFLFWCLGFCPQQAVFYSLRVMLHLKPEAIAEPVGWWVGSVFIFESILGPVLIGLFGLALRQRLKR
jgi:uncharacterized protein YjbI with pentapeptide repeats